MAARNEGQFHNNMCTYCTEYMNRAQSVTFIIEPPTISLRKFGLLTKTCSNYYRPAVMFVHPCTAEVLFLCFSRSLPSSVPTRTLVMRVLFVSSSLSSLLLLLLLGTLFAMY